MDQNTNPVETNFPSAGKPEHSSGPIIAAVVLVITLVLAGVYLMKGNEMQITPPEVTRETPKEEPALTAETDPETAALTQQSTSDEVTAIEADLNATDLEALTAFIDEI